MMTRITKKILLQTTPYELFRSLSVSQNLKNNSLIYLNSVEYRKRYYSSSSFLFTKNVSKNSSYHSRVPLYIAFQKRNISNTTSTFEKLSQIPTPNVPPVNDTVNIVLDLPKSLTVFSDWKIVEIAQQTLLQVHETTGLPWWATITLTALGARTFVTLPFSIFQLHNTAKYELAKEEMKDIIKTIKYQIDYNVSHHGWSDDFAKKEFKKKAMKEWKELVVEHNCHPAKSLIIAFVQIPLWFSFSVATRNLCFMLPRADPSAQVTYLEMTVGGFGWVTNLTTADPYMALPIIFTIMNLLVMEINYTFINNPSTKDQWIFWVLRSITCLLLPLAIFMPAATNVYWLTNSSFTVLQTFMLRSTRLRRLFKVPITKSESEHPYRHFYSNLKSRLRLSSN